MLSNGNKRKEYEMFKSDVLKSLKTISGTLDKLADNLKLIDNRFFKMELENERTKEMNENKKKGLVVEAGKIYRHKLTEQPLLAIENSQRKDGGITPHIHVRDRDMNEIYVSPCELEEVSKKDK